MGLKVTNNAFGTLNAGINSSATTIVLAAGQGARFPSLSAGDYFYATLIDVSNNLEIVKVTARSTDTMTVVRGQDSTTARAYSTNDRFELRPTAALFNEKANANEYLPLAGGTMTGNIVMSGYGVDTDSDNGTLRLSANASQSTGGVAIQLWGKDVATWGGGVHYLADTRGVDGTHRFWTWDGTNFVNRATIDASGRMLLPYQPAFQTNGAGYSLASNEIYAIRPSALFNIGSHYNTSNGRFTAPVAGRYHFHFLHTTASSGAAAPTLYFRINGSGTYGRTLNYYTSYSSGTQVVLLNLNAGDYVEAIIEAWNSTAMTTWETSWGGYLVG